MLPTRYRNKRGPVNGTGGAQLEVVVRPVLKRRPTSPLGVQEVAERVGLHANTARFQLDVLVEAGLAARAAQARGTRGRLSIVYQAVTDSDAAGLRHYRLLGEMLASLIVGMMSAPGKAAVQAGREWGRTATAPMVRVTAGEALGHRHDVGGHAVMLG
jgi:predicted ArsR family transcriptional regulator